MFMPNPRRIRGCLAAILAFAVIGGGVARAQSPVPESQLETFLGLSTGSGLNTGDLTNLGNGPVTSGSAIMQSITVSAGATLTFDYDFLTNAPSPASNPLGAVGSLRIRHAADPDRFRRQLLLSPMAAAPAGRGSCTRPATQIFSETFTTAGTYCLESGSRM